MPRARCGLADERRGSCASSSWPCSVAMLSGWNCTPWIGSSRCRSAHDQPSSRARGDLQARPAGSPARRPANGSGWPGTARAGRRSTPRPSCSIGLSLAVHRRSARGRRGRRRPGRSPDGPGRRRGSAAGRRRRAIRSRQMPARSGSQGPGESTMRVGPQRQRLLRRVSASLRRTTISAPSSPR